MFSVLSTLAALAISALVGFLFRQQLEDLSTRISDLAFQLKDSKEKEINTLFGHAEVNKRNIEILNNRVKIIENLFPDVRFEVIDSQIKNLEAVQIEHGLALASDAALIGKLQKDRKPVVIISAYDRPNPVDFGFDENEPAFSIHRGWPSPGAEKTYLNAVKEFEAGWPSRMVTANNKLPERPIPSDFGFVERESGMDGEGGWTLEGGEEAYFDALKKYELMTCGRTMPYGLEEKLESLQDRVTDIEERGTTVITIGSIPVTADIPANVDAAEVTKKVSENVMELIQGVKVIGSESSTKG